MRVSGPGESTDETSTEQKERILKRILHDGEELEFKTDILAKRIKFGVMDDEAMISYITSLFETYSGPNSWFTMEGAT